MKRQIRFGVFETNSSSVHTLTMMMKNDYDKWTAEDLYLKDGRLYTKEEVVHALQEYDRKYEYEPSDYSDEEEFDDARKDFEYELYADENEDLEEYYEEFTTPNGEIVVAFGRYGNEY